MEPVETTPVETTPAARPRMVRARLPESFTVMFAGLYASAFHAAFRLLGDRDAADEIAQEACAKACLRWDRIRKRHEPRPWIVHKATTLALREWNRRARAVSNPPGAEPESTDVSSPLAPVDERRADLHRALATLPRRQRQAVVLRYIAELSENDTADVLGWRPDKVVVRGERGLVALRGALGGVV